MDRTQQTQQRPQPQRDDAHPRTTPLSAERSMPCPNCGHEMPDLKGGKASICPVCGYKESCCY